MAHCFESLTKLDELFSEEFSIKKARVYTLEESQNWKPLLIEDLSLVKMEFSDNGQGQ